MRHLKLFEEFLKDGTVRKTSPDIERAKNLVLEAERKFNSLLESGIKIGVKDENANDYVEHCYDIIMFLIRGKLYVDWYSSSGHGAHEAETSFARKLEFDEKEIEFLDQLRYFRNGILYYGKRYDKEYAEKVIEFTKKKYLELRKMAKWGA